jgi:hypothetical protein
MVQRSGMIVRVVSLLSYGVSFLKSPKPLKQQIEKICSTRSWDVETLILVDADNNVIDIDIACSQLTHANIYLKVNPGKKSANKQN